MQILLLDFSICLSYHETNTLQSQTKGDDFLHAPPHFLDSITQFPIVSLTRYQQSAGLSGQLLACLAYGGSTASIKSPLAYGMLSMALESNRLRPSQLVVEASAGTFGAALAVACKQLGHPLLLCVSDSTAPSRIDFLKSLGAQIHSVSNVHNQPQLNQTAAALAQEQGGYFVDCFNNDLNPEFHRRVTAPAILRATNSQLDHIIIGVGTGGTITGVGEYVKAWSNISIVAVEPCESQALTGGFCGAHTISGIGVGFVPENYNPYVVNRVVAVSSGDAAYCAQQILLLEGIPVCQSGGAVIEAARRILLEKPNSRVLCIFSAIEPAK